MSPTSSPTTLLLSFVFTHLPLFSGLPCFASPEPPPFTLFPSDPSAPVWERGLVLSSRGWNPMFTFSCICPHPMWRFEEPEKNLLLYLGLSPALLFP